MSRRDVSPGLLRLALRRRVSRIALTLVVVIALFGAIGVWIVPPIVKHVAVDELSAKLGRPVQIDDIALNPYTLKVTVQGMRILEGDQKTVFASFGTLLADVSISSVYRRAPVLDAVTLSQLRINTVRDGENHYNFTDILEKILAEPPSPEPARFSINNIRLIDARIDFDDRPQRAKHTLTDISLSIPFISNLPAHLNEYVQPAFSARVDGAPVELKGETKPFQDTLETHVAINVDSLDVPEYMGYLPLGIPVRVDSGRLDTRINLNFQQTKDKPPTLQINGKAGLRDVTVSAPEGPLGHFAKLDVDIASIDPVTRQIDVRAISLQSPQVKLHRNSAGRINGMALIAEQPAPPASKTGIGAAPPAMPLHVTLAHFELKDGKLEWQDEANRVVIDKLDAVLPALAEANQKSPLVITTDKAGAAQVSLDGLGLALNGLHYGGPGAKQDAVRVAQLDVDGLSLYSKDRQLRVAGLVSHDASIALRRDAKGDIVLLPQSPSAARTKREVRHAESDAEWNVRVDKLTLAKYGLNFVDEALGKPVRQDIVLMQLDAENLSNARGEKGVLKVQLAVNRKGTVAIASDVTLAPLNIAAQVDARRLAIAPVQPYIARYARVNVGSGTLSARGQLGVAEEAGGMRVSFAGSGGVANFSAVDTGTNEDLLNWSALSVDKVSFDSRPANPVALSIGKIVLNDFYSRLVINPDATLNVQNIVVAKPASASATDAPQPVAANAPVTRPAVPAAKVRIDAIRLARGRVNFSDHYVKPNYSANLAEVEGSVTGLSSDPASRAQVDLHGRYDRTAPVAIKGTVNPLRGDLLLDIQASCKDIDLPSFTTYSQKYAGYGITKGKLSLDVSYKIENRRLEAKNNLFLDQLTFGEKVESPDATKLPVLLAVALLKNHRGEINIDLPVAGSLDDPQFSVGGLIVKVIVNLLAKAATAPFALLGAAFGGGEELSYIEFEPGRSALVKAEEGKLQTLVKALKDRPGLKLEIAGRVDEANDLDALKRYTLLRKVKAVKRDELASSEAAPTDLDDVVIDPKDYPRLLKIAYGREKIAKPRNFLGMAKDLPVPEMEQVMLAGLALDAQATQALALRRAEQVKAYLIEKGEVGADRLFVVTGGQRKANEKAKASRVDLSLN